VVCVQVCGVCASVWCVSCVCKSLQPSFNLTNEMTHLPESAELYNNLLLTEITWRMRETVKRKALQDREIIRCGRSLKKYETFAG
jgi:hypothetical protein